MRTNGLRVEEPVSAPVRVITAPESSVEHWRGLALSTGERLAHAETQLKDLRKAADEARARLTKSKERQDSAQARVNELQSQLVAVTAERDDLKAKVLTQDAIKRAVWDMAQRVKDSVDQGVSDVLATL